MSDTMTRLFERLELLTGPEPQDEDELAEQWCQFREILGTLQRWWLKHSKALLETGHVAAEQAALGSLLLLINEDTNGRLDDVPF